MENRKEVNFDINDMAKIGLVLVITGIVIALGLQIMGDVQTDMVTGDANCGANSTGGSGGTIGYSACPAEFNATGDAIEGVAKLPAKMPIIATVVVAAIIIGIIIRYLRF